MGSKQRHAEPPVTQRWLDHGSERDGSYGAALTAAATVGETMKTAARFDRVEKLLRDRGANHIDHPGGNLLDHVERVGKLLRAWGADEDVQLTGLSHACYGTADFARFLLGLEERPLLAEIIGERAEAWVYLYASCDREVVYSNLANLGPLHFQDRFTGKPLRCLSRTRRCSLNSLPPMSSTL
jgi:hypothetical protein